MLSEKKILSETKNHNPKFYISTIIVKVQLNDKKIKIKIYYLQHSTNYLHTRLCHVTFMIVIRSLWYRVFVKENIWSMQDDDSLLRSFVTIKPAAEKILSDGTAKYRRTRTESLEYLSELSFHHARESVTGI